MELLVWNQSQKRGNAFRFLWHHVTMLLTCKSSLRAFLWTLTFQSFHKQNRLNCKNPMSLLVSVFKSLVKGEIPIRSERILGEYLPCTASTILIFVLPILSFCWNCSICNRYNYLKSHWLFIICSVRLISHWKLRRATFSSASKLQCELLLKV